LHCTARFGPATLLMILTKSYKSKSGQLDYAYLQGPTADIIYTYLPPEIVYISMLMR